MVEKLGRHQHRFDHHRERDVDAVRFPLRVDRVELSLCASTELPAQNSGSELANEPAGTDIRCSAPVAGKQPVLSRHRRRSYSLSGVELTFGEQRGGVDAAIEAGDLFVRRKFARRLAVIAEHILHRIVVLVARQPVQR